ncbi:hypothetical protein [Methylobacterium oxalidis]|uniref:Uncharacterized protein n=1 Tax=Methylobacterium oxalidis TaxID=944322 RepID=A0A512J9A9_9HYPH|nr:hypothetical protein [Methylobacterium oxalidis]GEP06533.1 hypothetical protein MOX02_45710 [Methylobacterium oxalidis]GJE30730.1 hypothetical protein LDDCCGHA_0899 [Methylobacterium oxalidis]GLS63889.1 hypothetical protein GCM10007888_22700 [Methylobacterium oxalidis]
MADPLDQDPVHDAIEALRAAGRTVMPAEGGPGLYRVDHGPEMTGADVLAMAIGMGLLDGPDEIE